MSNSRHLRRQHQRFHLSPIESYVAALEAKGFPEREVAGAYFYAEEFGLEAMSSGDGSCITFLRPSCLDWNCVRPEHQILGPVDENAPWPPPEH